MNVRFAATTTLGPFHYEAGFEADEEILVLYGHSGAGKSLTLKYVAGLMQPLAGVIEIGERTVFDGERGINVPPQQRGVGYVVQDLALFRNMTVAENILFGVNGDSTTKSARLSRMLQLTGLEGFDDRMPRTLSGGQAQRVALARALARDASVLLLDEPFSALDDSLRQTMRRELLRLRRELGLTIIFVTHDLREAHLLADRLAVFDHGQVLQLDDRENVFRRPTNRRVAELTGIGNTWSGVLAGRTEGAVLVDVSGHQLTAASVTETVQALSPGDAVEVAIRAERVNLRRGRIDSVAGANLLEARALEDLAYGASHTLHFASLEGGLNIEIEIASRPYEILGVANQENWVIELPADDLHVMPSVSAK